MIHISDKALEAFDKYKTMGYSNRRALRQMKKDGHKETDIGCLKLVCSRKFKNRNKPRKFLFWEKPIIKY
jgi:hypothetical protein